MKDLEILLDDGPGALAEMGDALGRAGISIEGGGADVLRAAGIRVSNQRDVVMLRLRQAEPGQLGAVSRRMAEAGVNIEVMYSDHDHNLVLVVDDEPRARVVSDDWMRDG